MAATPETVFTLTYQGKLFTCSPVHINDQVLYKINFGPTGFLYLTLFITSKEEIQWTAIPQQPALCEVIAAFGKQIENHLVDNLCATTTDKR